MNPRSTGNAAAVDSDAKRGHGPDDMGDDEQEFEVSEYEQYIEDPPDDGLVIAEDDDDDAEAAEDWAARHPKAATRPEVPDEAAEETAMHEVPDE
jgi:hypothetical protein